MTRPMVALDDLCDCLPLPVNLWQLPDGTWTIGASLAYADTAGVIDAAIHDATEYQGRGCTSWVIACPECGRVFAAGGEP